MKLSPRMKETTLRERPVLEIQGAWTEAFSAQLRGRARGPAAALLQVSAPDSVRLYIDRETGFPHRIQYLKQVPGREVSKPMLTIDFLEVVLNQPINGSEFDFVPPSGGEEHDLTQSYIDAISPPEVKSPSRGPG